jgi:hypothetical protein
LIAWANYVRDSKLCNGIDGYGYAARDIAEWMNYNEDFNSSNILTNARTLGKYLTSHINQIENSTGIFKGKSYGNRAMYFVGDSKIDVETI